MIIIFLLFSLEAYSVCFLTILQVLSLFNTERVLKFKVLALNKYFIQDGASLFGFFVIILSCDDQTQTGKKAR